MPQLEALGATSSAELQRRSGRRCSRRSSGWPRVAHVPLSAQPNAGRPREIEGRNIYLCSPEYMASYARRFVNNGVRLVGGCCGTTPEHIRHIKSAVRALSQRGRRGSAGRGADQRRPDVRRSPPPNRLRRWRSRGWPTRSRAAVRRQRRAAAAARARRRGARRAGAPAAHSRRGLRQHSRRSARERADERARRGARRPAAGRHRDDPPLRVPRSKPARDAVGSARRALDGRAQPAAHHRRSAARRRLPGRDRVSTTSIRSA